MAAKKMRQVPIVAKWVVAQGVTTHFTQDKISTVHQCNLDECGVAVTLKQSGLLKRTYVKHLTHKTMNN